MASSPPGQKRSRPGPDMASSPPGQKRSRPGPDMASSPPGHNRSRPGPDMASSPPGHNRSRPGPDMASSPPGHNRSRPGPGMASSPPGQKRFRPGPDMAPSPPGPPIVYDARRQAIQNKTNLAILAELDKEKRRLLQNQSVNNPGARPSLQELRDNAEQQHIAAQQKAALQHAHAHSSAYFITQDSSFGNLILPVLPRFEPDN